MMMIPMIVFWVLMIFGRSQLGWKGIGIWVVLWLAAVIILTSLGVSPYVFVGLQAIMDIVLVLIIFGGDMSVG